MRGGREAADAFCDIIAAAWSTSVLQARRGAAKTYLLRLGMHRQPIRVEAFVVGHNGGESSCVCKVESKMSQGRGLIYEGDTKLQLLGAGRQSSRRQVTPKHRKMLVGYRTKALRSAE